MRDFALTYDDVTVFESFNSLPDASRESIVQAGKNHILGNVVAAAVVGMIRKIIRESKGDPKAEVTTADVKAYRAANEDAVEKLTADKRKEVIDALAAGTYAFREPSVRAPKLSPLAKKARDIAELEVCKTLVGLRAVKFNGVRFVLPNDKAYSGKTEFTFAGGVKFTMAQLIDRRLASEAHGARIKAEAEAWWAAEQAKLAEAASEAEADAGESNEADVEELGL